MRNCCVLFLIFIQLNILSQDKIEYICSNIDATPVFLNVTKSSEPMDYLGQSFYINKYELIIGTAKYHSFYTYKFNNKLYLLDEDATTLNYSKDQVLFDLYQENRVLDKASGVFNEVDLTLDEKLRLNNKEFYFYSANSIAFSHFNITKLIFDDLLNMNQMEIKSYLGTSQCVLQNIIIEPFERKYRKSVSPTIAKKKVIKKLEEIKFQKNWDKN
jgi:hypothetical protein